MESNHVRDLMEAYSSIYAENEEVEQLDEDFQGAVKGALEAGAKATDKFMKTNLVGKIIRPFVSPAGPGRKTPTKASGGYRPVVKSTVGEEVENWVNSLIDEGYDLSEYTWDDMCEMYMNLDEAKSKIPGDDLFSQFYRGKNARKQKGVKTHQPGQNRYLAQQNQKRSAARYAADMGRDRTPSASDYDNHGGGSRNEQADLFDIIKGHLLDEGFADTEEAALAIMTNMSEEWREEILDEANEIMSITSPEGKKKKVNRTYPSARESQNAQNARKLGALQKRQRLNPNAMGPRAARRQATDEVETNTRKSISRLNAAKNIEDKQADGDYENSIDHSKPYGKGKSGYMEVPTDYRARNRRARGR